ncbi:M20/M25/M40 family metallo-hydrolase [Rubellimicrobium arenae]|uniref:M20/M25/M40 family metallo-hydrolase n=1 Tax=Rubellimicrobium arenae TaxID=2817372 RepID=UPI001B315DD9|nr:M20/M25/M40 family metallo-hydrolase [Rubellimicrobium arenae]
MSPAPSTLREDVTALCLLPGLSGHEERVAAWLRERLGALHMASHTDRLGNLIVTLEGDPTLPSVMVFTHMDQLGFFVRKVEPDGMIRVERMGGVAEKAMLAQAVLLCPAGHPDVPGVITVKSHHATPPGEKYAVPTTPEIRIDTGHGSKAAVEAAGIRIGTPVVYLPRVLPLANDRLAGTAVDDRAGCAVLLDVTRVLKDRRGGPTVHLVWSVQEEFNLRGAVVAAQVLQPDIAIQIDLMLATDTPDMADRGEMALGGGPGMSLYSFHGRGTLNGVIPHPALVRLMERTAEAEGMPLQRSAQVGVLTDLSYVQTVGGGVASIDLGFPMRHSHSALEVCDLRDLDALARLIVAALGRIDPDLRLERDA